MLITASLVYIGFIILISLPYIISYLFKIIVKKLHKSDCQMDKDIEEFITRNIYD